MAEGRGGRAVLLPVALAASVTSLDTTVITVAAPSIRDDLGLSMSGLEWLATSYVLAFASLLLIGGRLADQVGRRRMLQLGMVLFAVASVVAAAAPDGLTLLAGRFVQGVGAAIVVPATLAVVAGDLRERQRHIGAGVFAAATALSLALGPLVGGVISQYWDWRWIFWINVPIVLLTLWSVRWAVPHAARDVVPEPGLRAWFARLDPPGLVLSTVSLSALTFALVEGFKLGVGSPVTLGAVAVSVLAFAGMVIAERRARFPLFDMDLVRHPVVAGGAGVQVLWGIGINGVFFFTSLVLQDVLRLSPTVAGFAFLPLAVVLVLVVPVSAWLATVWGAHRTIALGMAVLAAGLLTSTIVTPEGGFAQLLPGLLLVGIGAGITTPIASAMLTVVPADKAGVVSAVVSVAREISGVLGIAITGAVITVRETARRAAGDEATHAFLSGYRWALAVAAAASIAGGIIAWRTMDVRGHEAAEDAPVQAGDPDDTPKIIDVRDGAENVRTRSNHHEARIGT